MFIASGVIVTLHMLTRPCTACLWARRPFVVVLALVRVVTAGGSRTTRAKVNVTVRVRARASTGCKLLSEAHDLRRGRLVVVHVLSMCHLLVRQPHLHRRHHL